MIPFSVLSLATVRAGGDAREAFAHTVTLAQKAEALDYKRFWLAEHHNMTGVASAATAVLIGHVAGATQRIRVGSGGIMLPNHAPLMVAEQFGTLAALYPNRIDLGLGRAPGTDGRTAHALRRGRHVGPDDFPADVQELQAWLAPAVPGQMVQAVPGAGANVPLWILGSSLFGAQLAAALGLPFAFASHFAPQELHRALEIYRAEFQPSAQLDKPYVMVGANVLAADTDEDAHYHFTSQLQMIVNLRRGTPGPAPAPIRDMDTYWHADEKAGVMQMLEQSFVGSVSTVTRKLGGFVDAVKPDEIIVTAHVYDQAARLRSLELGAEIRDQLA